MEHPDRHWPLGDALRQGRINHGLSQSRCAKLAGFTPTVWGQLETGWRNVGHGDYQHARPRPETVAAAAGVVGLDVAEALRMAGHNPKHLNPGSSGSPTNHDRDITYKLAYLQPHQKNAVLTVIDAMLHTNTTTTPWTDQ